MLLAITYQVTSLVVQAAGSLDLLVVTLLLAARRLLSEILRRLFKAVLPAPKSSIATILLWIVAEPGASVDLTGSDM